MNTSLNQTSDQHALKENFFVCAVHQEIFNRVFPHIRHDLVGGLSASLMRASIMEKHLHKPVLDAERLTAELDKIEVHLRDTIMGIRELQFWDFDTSHEDIPSNIVQKSIKLMSSQLLLKNIQLSLQPAALDHEATVNTKPLLYSLLCVFCYIEDHDFANHQLQIQQSNNSIAVMAEPITAQDAHGVSKLRNLFISEAHLVEFAKHYAMDVQFDNQKIMLSWH